MFISSLFAPITVSHVHTTRGVRAALSFVHTGLKNGPQAPHTKVTTVSALLDHGLPRVVRGPVVIRAAAHGPRSPLWLGPRSGVLVARATPFLPNNTPWAACGHIRGRPLGVR